jgi:hypothetical protein
MTYEKVEEKMHGEEEGGHMCDYGGSLKFFWGGEAGVWWHLSSCLLIRNKYSTSLVWLSLPWCLGVYDKMGNKT